jgi:hypothetical protein
VVKHTLTGGLGPGKEKDTMILKMIPLEISAHQGPLLTSAKNYKGSMYDILGEWETGGTNYEPLDLITQHDPVLCAENANRNGLKKDQAHG